MDKKNEENKQIIIEEKKNKNGEIQITKYIKFGLLGDKTQKVHSNESKCYEVINQDNLHLSAMSIIPKKSRRAQNIEEALNIHKSLRHKNILVLEHYFNDSDNHYLLTEICHNGSLENLRENKKNQILTELEAQYYLYQLIDLLKYLRNQNIVHKNLNLRNLLISDKMELKLSNFLGAMKLESGEIKKTIKKKISYGRINYIAPEILIKNNYSYESDIWSLGIMLYKLLIGKVPFEIDYNNETKEFKIINLCDIYFPEEPIISNDAKDLIKHLLTIEPKDRIKLDEILNHDFFKIRPNIPKILPIYTLHEPPRSSLEYIVKIKNKNELNNNNKENKDNIKKENIEIEEKNKKIKELETTIINLNNEINKLNNELNQMKENKEKKFEILLKEEKEKNINAQKNIQELNEKLLKYEHNFNNDDKLLQLKNELLLKDKEIKELKEINARYPFELQKDENMISVMFISVNQAVNCSLICKNTDIFKNVENLLYDRYPGYRNFENDFFYNGIIVDKNKSLEENEIKDGTKIILIRKE